ncbi:MAG: AAA+ family ATPase, partial [Anaerolineae bacterium]|nr:AAA+ family ATPase [Anaerolineae bacterium]
ILPGMVPIDDPNVQNELTRYLEDNWVPVIEKDVDGPASLPLRIDRDNPNLGRYSASRRAARTIYLGTAPTAKSRNPGIDDRSVKLGCAQPGESVATFGDALRRLSDQATHLYVDKSRYWYSTQPSVTRLAQDRAAQLDREDHIWPELKRRLRADRSRGELAAVHPAPSGHGDVPDDAQARLVILGPEHPHVRRNPSSRAMQQVQETLRWRGGSPRLYQNMLVFLAPDQTRLDELEDAIRQYLAWRSIDDEKEILNLDTFQRNQASTKHKDAGGTVDSRIRETYIWLLSPHQEDAQNPASLEIEETRLGGQDALAVQASRKLKNEEWLITDFGGLRLRLAMDRYNLWAGSNRVGLKQLWEYFARYPYLPRLLDDNVLLGAVQDGIGQITWQENFAYADGYDDKANRYLGLKAGERSSVRMDSSSLLVRADVAARQIQADQQARAVASGQTPPAVSVATGSVAVAEGDQPAPSTPAEKKLHRFYGVVQLDALRVSSDAAKIAEAIIQHLEGLPDAEVDITLEIQARLPDGAPENVVRTVTENARTLKFDGYGFEEA